MPADPETYCPVCGLEWQVRGCTPGKCRSPGGDGPVASFRSLLMTQPESARVFALEALAICADCGADLRDQDGARRQCWCKADD